MTSIGSTRRTAVMLIVDPKSTMIKLLVASQVFVFVVVLPLVGWPTLLSIPVTVYDCSVRYVFGYHLGVMTPSVSVCSMFCLIAVNSLLIACES